MAAEMIASVNQGMPAAGSHAGTAEGPSSQQPQVSFAGPVHMTVVVTPALPPVNRCMPPESTTHPAAPSFGSAVRVSEGAMDPQLNRRLSSIGAVGPTAAVAQEVAVPSAGPATGTVLMSQPQNWSMVAAPGTGAPLVSVPLGEGTIDPQQNRKLSSIGVVGPTASGAQEVAVPSAGPASAAAFMSQPQNLSMAAAPGIGATLVSVPVSGGTMDPQQNCRLPSTGVVGPTAAVAQEETVPMGGPASATAHMSKPMAAAPGSIGTKWTLPSTILKVAKLQPQDGCISRFDSPVLSGMCSPMVVLLGPLFPRNHLKRMEETKGMYVHNLILRANRKEDAEQKLKEYLTRIGSMEPAIRQRYDLSSLSECGVTLTPQELVEMMVLDGLFVIEVLVNHWMGKIKKGSASPKVSAAIETSTAGVHSAGTTGGSSEIQRMPLAAALVPQAMVEEFAPLKVSWEPHALRFDLVVVSNQIPFFVLEELFKMTEVPELREFTANKSAKLREIILDYLVGDIPDGAVLVGYDGPVYHILHLVYLHLTFSKEGTSSSSVSPLPEKGGLELGRRSSVVGRTLEKLRRMRMDLLALCKRTFSRSSDLPVGWKQWKVIPPLRELVRVGVRLKRVETFRFADVRFRDGKLEIPAFAWRRYHMRLLTNLVVLEMSGWWPREKRLFCSYVMFMSQLVVKKEDAALLFKKGIVKENNVGDVEKSLICPILILADFSHGSKYECRFEGIVGDVLKCYQRWSKVGVAPTSTQL